MESLLFAFRYFTNLPIPGDSKWDEKTAAASLAWLPLTGLILGLCLAALTVFFINTGFPQQMPLRALLVFAMESWIGGVRFLEGFSRTSQGFFSGRGMKRSLAATEGSSLDTKGALSLVFVLAGKLFLLSELTAYEGFLYTVLFYPCWTRWAVSFAACNYQSARDEGMAFYFKVGQKPIYILLSSVFLLLILFLMPNYFYAAALASLLLLLFCLSLTQARLGGQTEDTYGFAAVVAELSFLFFCAVSAMAFRYIGG